MVRVYEGFVEDGTYVLTTDGQRERPQLGSGFRWGQPESPLNFNTTVRLLVREVASATSVAAHIMRFQEEVVNLLPTDKPWRITSEDIRKWLEGDGTSKDA